MLKTILDEPEVLFQFELVESFVFLHLTVHKWSHNLYKQYLKTFSDFLVYMRSNGVIYVYCLVDPNDEKLVKFEKMFGFKELVTLPEGVVMERSTRYGS